MGFPQPTFFVPSPMPVAKAPWPVAAEKPVAQQSQVPAWAGLKPTPEKVPDFANDDAQKQLFGVELAKNNNAFEAACSLFEDVQLALWVSRNWAADPVCIAARDLYLRTLELTIAPLDKNQLAAKVLKFAEEKDIQTNRYVVDAKERLNAMRLYSDIMGYTGKVDINASTNFTHNEMTVKFVKPEVKLQPEKVVMQIPNDQSEILNGEFSPISIKLVGNAR